MSAIFTPTRYKLSVEDYHKLGDVGILTEDSRVELIEGELFEMAPIGGPHMGAVNRLTRLLVLAVGDRGVVSIQNPVALPLHSEPQPDVALLKPRVDSTASDVPGPDDVLLLIEVADTTLIYDRTVKLKLYAKAGIAEAWIVNLPSRCVEVYRDPTDDGYSRKVELGPGDVVSPLALSTVKVTVAEIFVRHRRVAQGRIQEQGGLAVCILKLMFA
jgi:Uma2 family endonuclease